MWSPDEESSPRPSRVSSPLLTHSHGEHVDGITMTRKSASQWAEGREDAVRKHRVTPFHYDLHEYPSGSGSAASLGENPGLSVARAPLAGERASGVAVVDGFGGVAGDMLLGALVDLGADLKAIETALMTLPLSGWSIEASRTTRRHLACTAVQVHVPHEHVHRHLPDILGIIDASKLPDVVKDGAKRTFWALAEAEAAAHDLPIEAVHFHEVGAADAILDICGVSFALHSLGIGRLLVGALPAGSGTVRCAHGELPCPVPAVVRLLEGFTLRPGEGEGEMITPTGAAILRAYGEPLSTSAYLAQTQDMLGGRSGYGAGTRASSIVRIWRLETEASSTADAPGEQQKALLSLGLERQDVLELRCQMDDIDGESMAFLSEQLWAAGALDVHISSTLMKKGRPAQVLTCQVSDSTPALRRVARALVAHASTIGFRERWILPRSECRVATPFGTVRIKVVQREGRRSGSPEYEDCAELARRHGRSLAEIRAAAVRAFEAET